MPDFLKKEIDFDYSFLDAKACLNELTPKEQNELIANKTDIEFEPGEIIVKRGLSVSHVLYLIDGLVKLEFVNDGKLSTVGLIHSHQFIGIICCFAFEKFDFTVTALEKTKVSFIDKNVFENFIKTNPGFALNLIKHMSGVSNGLLHRITNLSQKNIDGALSIILLDFADLYKSDKFKLPMVRKELANMLGYSKESVINTLSKFNREGILKVSDRNIEIVHKSTLIQISKIG
jgi:CRP-like cAMP-binding protein